MRANLFSQWWHKIAFWSFLFGVAQISRGEVVTTIPIVTNLVQLHGFINKESGITCSLQLAGVVCAAVSDGVFVLSDESAAEWLHFDGKSIAAKPGQRIILSGRSFIQRADVGFRISSAPVVNNDGIHSLTEKSGSIALKAGKHRVRVTWFNYQGPSSLQIYWTGPDVLWQTIPSSALFRETIGPLTTTNWTNGLNYSLYEGDWTSLPPFHQLEPKENGSSTNFTLSVLTRHTNSALEFRGYLEIPQDGIYTFSTGSDDGSMLFIDELNAAVESKTSLPPEPRRLAVGQSLGASEEALWAEVEGVVTFIDERFGKIEMDVTSGTANMKVLVANTKGISSTQLMGSRIRCLGVCWKTFSSDAQSVAGLLLVPSVTQITIIGLSQRLWSDHPVINIGKVLAANFPSNNHPIVHVRGKCISASSNGQFTLRDDTGQIDIETHQEIPTPNESWLDALGQRTQIGSKIVLRCGFYEKLPAFENNGNGPALPLLTTVEQVKRLTQQEALREYPVKIRGVFTKHSVINDSTSGIYLFNFMHSPWHRTGEFWEIEGVSNPGQFAPTIKVLRQTWLGSGKLPPPIRPTRDQLLNGSLDTQFIELEGIIGNVDNNSIGLITSDGNINLTPLDQNPRDFDSYKDGLVRIRGTFLPDVDDNRRIKPGGLRIAINSICMDIAPPLDPFAVPKKKIPELLLYDPQATMFRRVKISGQVVHSDKNGSYLMEEDSGLQFVLSEPVAQEVGDIVELVGFPRIQESSLILRGAVMRKTGHGDLLAPTELPPNQPSRSYEATLVRLQAQLVDLQRQGEEQVLHMRSKSQTFIARLINKKSLSIPLKSQLDLTGVYVRHNEDRNPRVNAFELLLNSPSDIRVLTRPPWWTIQIVLWSLTLLVICCAAVLGVAVVRGKRKFREQIQAHRKAEVEFTAINQERNRVAGELHDTLEQSLAGVALQLDAGLMASSPDPQQAYQHFALARKMVDLSQEEVRSSVWDLRSRMLDNNSLSSALLAIGHQFSKLNVHIDVKVLGIPRRLPENIEHNLLRIGQAAITNGVRHGQARKIQVVLTTSNDSVQMDVQDDGRGFIVNDVSMEPNHFGLIGMSERAKRLGGTLEIQSAPGSGTTIIVKVPLSEKHDADKY